MTSTNPSTPERWPLDGPAACIVAGERPDVKGGIAIVAFPGRGLAATLAAAYLAETLDLRTIGRLDCDAIPSVAIVEGGEVVHPVRLLVGKGNLGKTAAGKKRHLPLAMFLSEVAVDEEADRSVAGTILAWCQESGIKTIVSSESVGLEEQDDPFLAVHLWGVGNTPKVNARLKKAKLPMAKEGVVAGVTGALLDQALETDVEVVALVAVGQGIEPDVRTAARLVEFLAKFLGLSIKLDRLKRETEKFEKHLRDIERRRLASQPHGATAPNEFV